MRKITYLFMLFVCCNNQLISQDEPVQKKSVLKEVSEGDTEAIKKRLENGESCSEKDKEGNTALHIAVKEKKFDIVELLLEESDIDVNAQNKDGNTSIMEATFHNDNPEMFKMLCNHHNANLLLKNKREQTVLHLAVIKNNDYAVELIVEKNPSLICAYDLINNQPLYMVGDKRWKVSDGQDYDQYEIEKKNRCKIAQLLIARGAPLPSSGSNCDKLMSMLQQHCSIGLDNSDNIFLFCDYLLRKGNFEAIGQLIERKTDMTKVVTVNGDNLLHHWCRMKRKLERKGLGNNDQKESILRLMLPELINQKNNNGETPIFVAIKNNDIAMIKELKRHKADLSIRNNDGYTPLHYAVSCGITYDEILEQLGKRDYPDRDLYRELTPNGNTAAHIAAENGYVNGLDYLKSEDRWLLQYINDGNETPFMSAAYQGKYNVVHSMIMYHDYTDWRLIDEYFINGQVQVVLNTLKDSALPDQQNVYSLLNEEYIKRLEACQKVVYEYENIKGWVKQNKTLMDKILAIDPLFFETHPAYKPIEPIYRSIDQVWVMVQEDRRKLYSYYEKCREKERRAWRYLDGQYQCLCKKQ